LLCGQTGTSKLGATFSFCLIGLSFQVRPGQIGCYANQRSKHFVFRMSASRACPGFFIGGGKTKGTKAESGGGVPGEGSNPSPPATGSGGAL